VFYLDAEMSPLHHQVIDSWMIACRLLRSLHRRCAPEGFSIAVGLLVHTFW
jgi:hypothetical protein